MTEHIYEDIFVKMKPRRTKPTGQDLGALLRDAISQSGLTRNKLSELSGVRYAPLWKFMADDGSDVTLTTASKLLAALELRVELKPPKSQKSRRDD